MNKRIAKAFLQAQGGNRLHILDIGARGGLQWPWNDIPPGLIKATLVEPDPIEAEKLLRQCTNDQSKSIEILPFALWSSNTNKTLNVHRSGGTSSLFETNRDFLSMFPEPERFDIVDRLTMNAVSVKHLAENSLFGVIDFAKIDIQGAELEVLKGGASHFRSNLVGLEVEVEFSEMYSGQPLFRDIDKFVQEELGLALWDIRGSYWRYKTKSRVGGSNKGQLVFGDALYLRPVSNLLEFLRKLDPKSAKHKLISLALTATSYGYYDYTAAILGDERIREIIKSGEISTILDALPTRKTTTGGFLSYRLSSLLYRTLGLLANNFRTTHNGWAFSKENLGSRRFGPFWWT